MCLPEKIAAKLKTAETMETAWVRLDAWFGDRGLFIKDLMQDIKTIKDGDDEILMDYYVMLQSHIAEARNAGLLEMLLIPANVEMMVLPLSTWEKRVWRGSRQAACRGQGMVHGGLPGGAAGVRHHGCHERAIRAAQADPSA
jgi:hypothetical protein